MSKRKPTINYTSREYATIRRDLLAYAERYYPDTFRDFNEASFGSLMIDTVSYIGDILSFYLDYQANESFLDTAIEYNNIIRLGRQQGFKFARTHASTGQLSCYVVIPAISEGLGPDLDYFPVLRKNSTFNTSRGSVFTLIEEVDFAKSDNEVVVAAVNPDTGVPISYAIKAHGKIMSGEIVQTTIPIRDYERFKKIEVRDTNITEIIAVFDSEGREYFEVDYLSQNVVYKEVLNTNSDSTEVANILKPVVVPRRFTVINERNSTFLQFGYGSESAISDNVLADPSDVVLNFHGRSHTTDLSFDPSKLIETDKFGIVPANTILRVVYRKNKDSNVNAAVGTITGKSAPIFKFKNKARLVSSKINGVMASLEVENENPVVGDVSLPGIDELKIRMGEVFATQNRAVTKQDYKALIYSMPAKFGAIKRCNIIQDHDSFKRNMNLYVVSSLRNGQLAASTDTLKENVRTWLNKNRMINDTIDILDAKIVNIKIDFEASINMEFDKFVVFNQAIARLRDYFLVKMDIGENLIITDIYNALNKIKGISDVDQVKVTNAFGSGYSSVKYNIEDFTSANGKVVYAPENVIFEVKYLFKDIKGAVK